MCTQEFETNRKDNLKLHKETKIKRLAQSSHRKGTTWLFKTSLIYSFIHFASWLRHPLSPSPASPTLKDPSSQGTTCLKLNFKLLSVSERQKSILLWILKQKL